MERNKPINGEPITIRLPCRGKAKCNGRILCRGDKEKWLEFTQEVKRRDLARKKNKLPRLGVWGELKQLIEGYLNNTCKT